MGSSLFSSVRFNGTFKPEVTPWIWKTTWELSKTDPVLNEKECVERVCRKGVLIWCDEWVCYLSAQQECHIDRHSI